jgi:hypothetical protein
VNDEQLARLMDKVAEDHARRDQTYGAFPYRKHLEDVERLIRTACSVTWAEEESAGVLIAAGILHDWFEDCLNPAINTGEYPTGSLLTMSLLAWSEEYDVSAVSLLMALRVTDPAGQPRREAKRAVLPGILACEGARAVKLADRIANLQQGISERSSRHLRRYLDEAPQFAPVVEQGMTPDDAIQETRQYAAVRNWLAGQYLDVLGQAAAVLQQIQSANELSV